MPQLLRTDSGIFVLDEMDRYLEYSPEVVESFARYLEGWGFTDAMHFCHRYPLEIIIEEMNEIRRELAAGEDIREPGALLRARVKERWNERAGRPPAEDPPPGRRG